MPSATPSSSNGGTGKKKPFAAWFKKVTGIKGSNSIKRSKKERNTSPAKSESVPIVNRPGHDETAPIQRIPSNDGQHPGHQLPQQQPATGSFMSLPTNNNEEGQTQQNDGATHSGAPTLATNPDTITSDAGQSKSGTTNTAGAAVSTVSGGGNSIFSSSNHSSRSLTTTLTTVQSAAPSAHLQHIQTTNNTTPTSATHPGHQHHASQGSTYFSHQYPTTPLSAVPQHLQAPATLSHLPTTYRSATANNLLTDNASILTLASSSHNVNRRNSLDTAASVRAIAPSSQWGGSRESLPLSVLSANTEAPSGHVTGQRPSVSGLTTSEWAGVSAPALSSERNSVYRAADASSVRNVEKASDGASLRTREADATSLRGAPDAASLRSGIGSHGRNDSLAGSISGIASTREPVSTGAD